MQKQIAEIMLNLVQDQITLSQTLEQMHNNNQIAELLALKMNLKIHVNNKKGLLICNSPFLIVFLS